eukprot:m.150755 g.150755  ORF g.150755 m.150755 type:complete len:74 (+) comp14237_c0_seq4:3069-3290(+)
MCEVRLSAVIVREMQHEQLAVVIVYSKLLVAKNLNPSTSSVSEALSSACWLNDNDSSDPTCTLDTSSSCVCGS